MGDGFIGVAAVAAVRRMLGIKPVQMKIQFCMSGSEMEDGALISSVQEVDTVLRHWFFHVSVHYSACFPFIPSF